MQNPSVNRPSLNIGIRGHDYGTFTAETLDHFLTEIKQDGFSNVQLVLWKLLSEVTDNLQGLTPEIRHTVEENFSHHGIDVSNLGSYFNAVNPDLSQRELDIQRFCQLIDLAADCGFSMVGTETGSVNRDLSFSRENHTEALFNEAVSVIRRLVNHAEQRGVNVGIEGVEVFTIHDIASISRLIKSIDSPRLRIIFDPVKLISLNNFRNHESLIEDAFSAFGDKISLVHFKDFKCIDGRLIRVPLGQGVMNYELLVNKMYEYKVLQGVIEEISKNDSKKSLRYIREVESHCLLLRA